MPFDDERRVFVDALGYRKGKDPRAPPDGQVHGGKAAETGADQQLGPLNPYERRIVHMAVAQKFRA